MPVKTPAARYIQRARRSLVAAVWFSILTFPIMVIRANTATGTVVWRWHNIAWMLGGTFVGSFLWTAALDRKQRGGTATRPSPVRERLATIKTNVTAVTRQASVRRGLFVALLVIVAAFPFVSGMYQTNIVTTALLYVVLGLGLNIIIGLGGMLHIGYIAFYALGAYTYALLNYHYGLNFWFALPIGAFVGGFFSLLIGIPVLRLRGDYLAIVTLAFAEITRLVLENWNTLTFGTAGIRNIPRAAIPGVRMMLPQTTVFTYFIMIAIVALTVFVVNRLEKSRIGRQMVAMKEDVIACQAMGVNIAKTKLTALTLGGVWAGLAGVVFAARTTFINPASFSVWESIIVLCTVVLGGMGSIPGVIVGALVLILVPEYLRAFAQFRMLLFGAVLVTMMVFRPGGLIPKRRAEYRISAAEREAASTTEQSLDIGGDRHE
ncbi:MAG: branched-chain amino acid ABC transporter permease [Spirochaetaceae bacterium]|nr:MAG: branched-chain amino acid ABC transporter permease [Spirochaetaceae bacterium]